MLRITPTTRARQILIASVAIAGLLAAPLAVLAPPMEAAFPGYQGKIAFDSSIDGDREVFVMNADGTGVSQLTDNAVHDGMPDWSPDGTKIVFWSARDGNDEIYVMNADGSGQVNLSNNPAAERTPTWSPDSTKIAFWSDRGGHAAIYVMNPDGTGVTQLTTDPTFTDKAPKWSPDGTSITFWRAGNGLDDVWVMNADATNQRSLVDATGQQINGGWSPDGTKILFEESVGGERELWVAQADGTNATRLTNNPGIDRQGEWSPDGSTIVFISARDGGGLFTMNPDGTNVSLLYNGDGGEAEPDWQPTPNQAPVTQADTLAVPHNTAGAVAVLANDADEEALAGSNLSITAQPSHGSAAVDTSTGKISYTPAAAYVGADSLTYQICDSFILDQKCSTAVLGVTVQAGPTPAKPTITSVGTVTMNGASTVYYTGHRPTFAGTSVPGATITVLIESDPITLTTTADNDGNWSVTPDQDIPDGQHTVTITATKDGSTSESLTFVLGINTFIPDTGADTVALRLVGLGLLAGGVGTGLLRRRRVSGPRVPSLFP